MFRTLAIFALLLLPGLASGGGSLPDECYEDKQITLRVVWYSDHGALNAAFAEIAKHASGDTGRTRKRNGFAIRRIAPDGSVVEEIHVLKVRRTNDKERMMLGFHEVLHCLCGEYHPVGVNE